MGSVTGIVRTMAMMFALQTAMRYGMNYVCQCCTSLALGSCSDGVWQNSPANDSSDSSDSSYLNSGRCGQRNDSRSERTSSLARWDSILYAPVQLDRSKWH